MFKFQGSSESVAAEAGDGHLGWPSPSDPILGGRMHTRPIKEKESLEKKAG